MNAALRRERRDIAVVLIAKLVGGRQNSTRRIRRVYHFVSGSTDSGEAIVQGRHFALDEQKINDLFRLR